MPNSLENTIAQLASRFAEQILDALRDMSLEEILSETGRRRDGGGARPAPAARSAAPAPRKARGGRLARRSAQDIAKVVEQIVGLLKKNKSGLRAEQIRAALNLDARELPRPIDEALAAKKITKKGQKRATTYFAK